MSERTPSPSGRIDGRRHHLAILFSDLCNSTAIASLMEPEQYAALLQSLRDIVSTAVTRHGGEIARIDGDGALCIFGYPSSHEDAGRRATEAALDIHTEVDALPMVGTGNDVRLHSGIHAGLVLLREGDMTRGRFEMLGDATNVAARLCDCAGAGEIVVSESALGADRHFFRTGPAHNLDIAGHAANIAVFAVQGREISSTRFDARTRAGLTPFAGRGPELARLHAWLANPPAGRTGPTLIAGPPGIGKTRMLGEFLKQAGDMGVAVHRGYCESYLGAPPLQPFVQLAQSMITVDSAATAAGAHTAISDDPSIAGDTGRLADGMRVLIDQAARDGGCILAIDDWQWADGASRKLLDALLPIIDLRARIVLVSRDSAPRFEVMPAGAVIHLPPLPGGDARAVTGALLSSADPFLTERICVESGGNPLFLEELCHAARRRRVNASAAAPSAWLDMLIQARFAQLRPDQAALVRQAAIIGHSMPAWLFTAVTGTGIEDPLIDGLAAADFLYPGDISGTLRFKHGIARDAVYRTIGLDERRALHHKVIDALHAAAMASGGAPNLDALAYHYAAGGDLGAAIPYAIKAGDAALLAGAVDRAQAHYRAAFEALAVNPGDAESAVLIWKLVNKYGLACIADPSPDQMPVLARMAIRMAALGHSQALVRSKYWIGAIAYGLGDGRRSAADLTSALLLAREHGQDRLIPQIELKLAQSLLAAGDYEAAGAMFDGVLPVIQASAGRNDREALAYGLCCHGFLLADQGHFAAADLRYADASALMAGAAIPLLASYLTQISAVSLMRGQWAEALDQAQRCIAACGSTHARYQAMMANALGAYARWQIDRDSGAIATLEAAARWFASDASRQRTSLVYGWLSEIMQRTGAAQQARHYAALAIRRVRDGGDRLGEAMAYQAVARLAVQADDRHRPEHYLASAYRSATHRASPREYALAEYCEAELALLDGNEARAATLLGRAAEAFGAMGAPAFVMRARALMPQASP